MTPDQIPVDDQSADQRPPGDAGAAPQETGLPAASEPAAGQPVVEGTPGTDDLDQFIIDLESPHESVREMALLVLLNSETSNDQVLRALENTAANDPNPTLRESALAALKSPVHQMERYRGQHYTPLARQWMHREISQWEADRLISGQQAAILRAHYPLEAVPAAPIEPAVKSEKPRSLKDILLSETSIKAALYLGAFFVIMAALIFGVAFEQARLPILTVIIVATYGAAFALVNRLPQASFVFYTIGTFLIPITALVLRDQVSALELHQKPFWMGVFAFMALVWAGGTIFYRSRLFSILGLVFATAAALILANWLSDLPYLIPLMLSLPAFLGLAGAALLRRWQGDKLFQPLFIAALILETGLLVVSVYVTGDELIAGNPIEQVWWFLTALTWLLGCAFYVLSQLIYAFPLFPLLAAAALVPVPFLVLGAFDPSLRAVSITAWVEATFLALSGSWFALARREQLHPYSLWLVIAGILVYALAAVLGLSDSIELGLVLLTGTAVVYLALTVWQRGVITWTMAILTAVLAYICIFSLDGVQKLQIGYAFVLLLPGLLYLGGELLARKVKGVSSSWYLPVRIVGILAALGSIAIALVDGIDEPWIAVIVLAVLAGFALLYALWDGRTLIGAVGTASLAVCIPYFVIALDWDHWLVLVYGLALLYWLVGTLLSVLKKDQGWSLLLRTSGLVLGMIGALSAPFEGGTLAVFGTALIASMYVVEALRLPNVWLGFPANLLYLGAYFMALVELDVSEPQFYSIAAGLLGILMHYLLLRSKHFAAAVATGVIAQLILLSTTYIQMVSSEKFIFFVILFVQSLLLVVYGLLVRSRSFLITPIAFVVLGVITVAFNILSRVGQLVLIGCTGVTLLALGVLALLLRERIARAATGFGERLGVWRW